MVTARCFKRTAKQCVIVRLRDSGVLAGFVRREGLLLSGSRWPVVCFVAIDRSACLKA
jgi:hypothetical protein